MLQPPSLKGLVEKNILIVEKRAVDRIKSLPKNVEIDFEFSAAQQETSDAVAKAFDTKNVCLLHGVTSSGKTQVYVKLIEKYFAAGQQVLYLLAGNCFNHTDHPPTAKTFWR